MRARIHLLSGYDLNALSDLNAVLATAPKDVAALEERAAVYRRLGRTDKAETDLNAACAMGKAAPGTHIRLGRIHFEQGRAPAALDAYDAALAADPKCVDALIGRAIVHERLGALDAALRDAGDAIEFSDIRDANVFLLRARLWRKSGEPRRAIVDVKAALAADRGNLSAQLMLADLYAVLQNPRNAAKAYSKALTHRAAPARAFTNRARALSELGHWDAARTDYDVAIARQPDHAGAHNGRARVFMALGRWDLAARDFTAAIDRAPNHAAYRLNRGRLYEWMGQTVRARRDYLGALAIDISNDKARRAVRNLQVVA